MRAKLTELRSSPNSGRTRMSSPCSLRRCSSLPVRVSRFVSCVVTSSTERNVSRVSSVDEMSTAITTSAPICRATSTGRFIAMPPSTSSRPSISIGASAAGIDMLARSERARLPERSTTTSPVAMSPATARNGTSSRSKSCAADEPGLLVDEEQVVVALAPERLQLPRRGVQERALPLEARDELLQLRNRHAGGIEAADDRADAGARQIVDGDVQLLERLQHADVRAAARAATGQREPDRAPVLRPGLRGSPALRERSRPRDRQQHRQYESELQTRRAASVHRVAPRGNGWLRRE